MSANDRDDRAAEILARCRLEGVPLGALPEDCRPADQAAAYRIQDRLHDRLVAAEGGPIVGYKIGCTTPVMQAFLGVDHPCAGGIRAGTVRADGTTVRTAEFRRLGLECEIAAVFGRTLEVAAAPFSRDDVADAVAALHIAFELVDDRYEDYRSLDVHTLTADDFFGAGAVLGPAVTDWQALDLPKVRGVFCLNGAGAGEGVGADILGHPLDALVWLADLWAGRGRDLRGGTLVLLGSLVETVWPEPGDTVTWTIDGLRSVSARFA